jgi:hypothetical protein
MLGNLRVMRSARFSSSSSLPTTRDDASSLCLFSLIKMYSEHFRAGEKKPKKRKKAQRDLCGAQIDLIIYAESRMRRQWHSPQFTHREYAGGLADDVDPEKKGSRSAERQQRRCEERERK